LKNNKNKLLRSTFTTFLVELIIWAISLPIIFFILAEVVRRLDFQWVYDLSPDAYHLFVKCFYFLFSRGNIFILIAIIWAIGNIVFLRNLFNKIFFYIDAISKASKDIVNKDIEFIELPSELEEVAKQMNTVKRESEKNERLAREAEQRKNDLVVYLAHDLKTPLTSVN